MKDRGQLKSALGDLGSSFGALGRLVNKATRGSSSTDPAREIKKTVRTVQESGEQVQYFLEQADKATALGFTKATKAFSMLDSKVVTKFDDMADMFDRLAYQSKTGMAGGPGAKRGGFGGFGTALGQQKASPPGSGNNAIWDILKKIGIWGLEAGGVGASGWAAKKFYERMLRNRGKVESPKIRPRGRPRLGGSYSTTTKSHIKAAAKTAEKAMEQGVKAAGKEGSSILKWLGRNRRLGSLASRRMFGKGGLGTLASILGIAVFDFALSGLGEGDEKKDATPENGKLEFKEKEMIFNIQHDLDFEISRELVFDAKVILWGKNADKIVATTERPKDEKSKITAGQVFDFAKELILPTPDLFGPDGKGSIPNPDTGTPGFGNFGDMINKAWEGAKGLFGGNKGGTPPGTPQGHGTPAPGTPMPTPRPGTPTPTPRPGAPAAPSGGAPPFAQGGGVVGPKVAQGGGLGGSKIAQAGTGPAHKMAQTAATAIPASAQSLGKGDGAVGPKMTQTAATATPASAQSVGKGDGLVRLAQADTGTMSDAGPQQVIGAQRDVNPKKAFKASSEEKPDWYHPEIHSAPISSGVTGEDLTAGRANIGPKIGELPDRANNPGSLKPSGLSPSVPNPENKQQRRFGALGWFYLNDRDMTKKGKGDNRHTASVFSTPEGGLAAQMNNFIQNGYLNKTNTANAIRWSGYVKGTNQGRKTIKGYEDKDVEYKTKEDVFKDKEKFLKYFKALLGPEGHTRWTDEQWSHAYDQFKKLNEDENAERKKDRFLEGPLQNPEHQVDPGANKIPANEAANHRGDQERQKVASATNTRTTETPHAKSSSEDTTGASSKRQTFTDATGASPNRAFA